MGKRFLRTPEPPLSSAKVLEVGYSGERIDGHERRTEEGNALARAAICHGKSRLSGTGAPFPREHIVSESEDILLRYEKRNDPKFHHLYSPLQAAVYLGMQEKERTIIRWINRFCIEPIENKRVLEIGCGSGSNLLDLIRIGFHPENIVGNELLEERANIARNRLPAATKIILGDAADIEIPDDPFDVVLQSTVFTSILDAHFQRRLADKMWELTKVGGGCFGMTLFMTTPGIRM